MKEQKERLKTIRIKATIVRHKNESRKENNAVCGEEKDFEMDSDFENASVLFAHPDVPYRTLGTSGYDIKLR